MEKRNLVVLFAAVLLLVSSSVLAGPGEDLFLQARNAYFEEDYPKAESVFTELKDREGYEWKAKFYLGMIYLQKGQKEEAEKYMEQSFSMSPDDYFSLVNYARSLYRKGHLEEAGEMLNLVPEENRKTTESYYNTRGLVAMAAGENKQAIEYFVEAAEVNPENYYVQNNLGLALIKIGDFQRAKEHLEIAVEQDPPEAFIYNNLGIAYENLNQLKAAKKNYERAVELNHPHAEENLKRVMDKLND